jgi:integrase
MGALASKSQQSDVAERVALLRQSTELVCGGDVNFNLVGEGVAHGSFFQPTLLLCQKPMSNNTILGALKRMGYAGRMTGHGFRGLASTLLHEQGYDHQHIELQLAHQERNSVSSAYNHATYLSQRIKMMQAWGDFIEAQTRSNVVQIDREAA